MKKSLEAQHGNSCTISRCLPLLLVDMSEVVGEGLLSLLYVKVGTLGLHLQYRGPTHEHLPHKEIGVPGH